MVRGVCVCVFVCVCVTSSMQLNVTVSVTERNSEQKCSEIEKEGEKRGDMKKGETRGQWLITSCNWLRDLAYHSQTRSLVNVCLPLSAFLAFALFLSFFLSISLFSPHTHTHTLPPLSFALASGQSLGLFQSSPLSSTKSVIKV